jgi:ketosteroid isomerase-like protein
MPIRSASPIRPLPALGAALILAVAAAAAARGTGAAPPPVAPGTAPVAPEPAPADAAEVLAVIEGWNRAFARNDPAAYFPYIDDGISVLTPSNPYRVDGLPDDREEFEHSLRLGTGRVGYFQELQPRVQRYGDVAVVTYHSRGSYGPRGNEKTLYLKETDVLVKRPSGWRIVHIHVSGTPQ